MRCTMAAWVVLFMALQTTARAEEPPARQTPVEPSREAVIAHFFPGYGTVPVDDLSSDIAALAARDPAYDHPDRSPTSIKADFDGNGFADYALLIRKTGGPDTDRIFVILMGHGHGRFSKAMESFFGGTAADVYLGYLPARDGYGNAGDAAGVEPPLKLQHPAVTLHARGQPGHIIYWDATRSELRIVPAATAR